MSDESHETDKPQAGGDRGKADAMLPAVYDELRQLAAMQFRRQPAGHTLQPTALVNEAWMKLARYAELSVDNREQFMMLASKVMRQVLVDHARARKASKRGSDRKRVTLSSADARSDAPPIDVLALDEALSELATLSDRKAKLVELRFFGGLTETEAAEALGISRSEATRQWRMARAWLSHKLREDDE